MKTKTLLLIAGTIIAGLVSATIVNAINSTTEIVGEPYTYSYSYCGAYAGSGGTRHCTLWLTAKERRVNTEVRGMLWNYTSYKIVAQ